MITANFSQLDKPVYPQNVQPALEKIMAASKPPMTPGKSPNYEQQQTPKGVESNGATQKAGKAKQ